jgi:hypothetical protein
VIETTAIPYFAGGVAGSAELVSFSTGKSGAVTLNPQAATIRLDTKQSAVVMQTKAARMFRGFRFMQRLLAFYGGASHADCKGRLCASSKIIERSKRTAEVPGCW